MSYTGVNMKKGLVFKKSFINSCVITNPYLPTIFLSVGSKNKQFYFGVIHFSAVKKLSSSKKSTFQRTQPPIGYLRLPPPNPNSKHWLAKTI